MECKPSTRHLLLPSRGETSNKDSNGGFFIIHILQILLPIYDVWWFISMLDAFLPIILLLRYEMLSSWLLQPCILLLQLSFQASIMLSWSLSLLQTHASNMMLYSNKMHPGFKTSVVYIFWFRSWRTHNINYFFNQRFKSQSGSIIRTNLNEDRRRALMRV